MTVSTSVKKCAQIIVNSTKADEKDKSFKELAESIVNDPSIDRKVEAIKTMRNKSGLGLKAAKMYIDQALDSSRDFSDVVAAQLGSPD